MEVPEDRTILCLRAVRDSHRSHRRGGQVDSIVDLLAVAAPPPATGSAPLGRSKLAGAIVPAVRHPSSIFPPGATSRGSTCAAPQVSPAAAERWRHTLAQSITQPNPDALHF